jgi:tRNA-specific 2-thiouridylase
LDIDVELNAVTVGCKDDLGRAGLLAERLRWTAGEPPASPFRAEVKVRARHTPAPAWIAVENEQARVRFDAPQPAVTPGQAAVFYRGELVLGGGWIVRATD